MLLSDILEAIEKIGNYISRQSSEKFIRDEKTVDAVVRNLGVIGDAAHRLPEDFKSQHPRPDNPWVPNLWGFIRISKGPVGIKGLDLKTPGYSPW